MKLSWPRWSCSPKELRVSSVHCSWTVPENTSPNRVAIFVDGANLFKSAAELRLPIDYAFLKERLAGDRKLVSARYFGSYKSEPTEEDERLQGAIREAGFELVMRRLKADLFMKKLPRGVTYAMEMGPDSDPFVYSEKGVDVALVTEMLSGAWNDGYDIAILVSGDGDYAGAVRELIQHGKKVEVVSFLHSASRELARSASRFLDLAKLLS